MLLLLFSITLDFVAAKKIHKAKSSKGRKFWFIISIAINLSLLGFFKYYNFFISTFSDAAGLVGAPVHPTLLKLVLPVGISFYTFHELSYIVDVFKKRIEPVDNYVEYALFVTFFPLLVAGPIERATHLLPQVQKKRFFDYDTAASGMKQILWGLFKKIVIADNCAEIADAIFNNAAGYSGSSHVLGAVFFAIQIYCDFSGYSDIALGTAKLFGFELLRNFSFPYFSRDIAEFWRRWHISLSSWFRDYLYIPLGGSKGSNWMKIRNTFIIFLVSGFWHGANWTFVVWGFLNAVYFMPLLIFKRNRNNMEIVAQGAYFPTFKEVFDIMLTFTLVVFAWIFFRAEDMSHAISYISKIFSKSLFTYPHLGGLSFDVSALGILVLLFFVIEWIGREEKFAIQKLFVSSPIYIRWAFYLVLIVTIGIWNKDQHQQFIYFHF